MLSKRSSKPPCPDRVTPVFFTSMLRLIDENGKRGDRTDGEANQRHEQSIPMIKRREEDQEDAQHNQRGHEPFAEKSRHPREFPETEEAQNEDGGHRPRRPQQHGTD